MKTPEQLADDAMDKLDPKTHAEWEAIRSEIAQAVYTDRAQRAPQNLESPMLTAWGAMEDFTVIHGDVEECSAEYIAGVIQKVIEAERAAAYSANKIGA